DLVGRTLDAAFWPPDLVGRTLDGAFWSPDLVGGTRDASIWSSALETHGKQEAYNPENDHNRVPIPQTPALHFLLATLI
ncbi:MAG: hypothetical protein ACK4UN_16330, partial [Limisphaerales bacterium]